MIKSSLKLFNYYRSLGEKSIAQLNDHQLHFRQHPEDNSIAAIVKHLNGNMLSRWTNFLTEDGEKTWRKRDEEFETSGNEDKTTIEKWLNEGWDCVENALSPLEDQQASDIVYIRNEGHTISEAIQRQIGHYAYHTGQIVMIAKSIQGDKWTSLSIAKGASKAYNANKMSQDKGNRHFTDKI